MTLGVHAALGSAVEAHRMASEIQHPNSLTIADAFHGYCRLMKGDITPRDHESLYLEYVRIPLKGHTARTGN